jgi:two-component system OmpR family sensor kinase
VPHDEYITYQILTRDGRVRLRSHQAPGEAFLVPVQLGFDWDPSGRRIYTEISVDGRFAIQIAEPAGHRSEAVFKTISLLLLPLSGLVLVAGWLVRRVVRRGLAPLLALQRELSLRGRRDLRLLSLRNLPDELGSVVGDVNLLLQRLAQALEAERSFAANSAHELRTPVAAALAQTQVLAAHLGEATPLGQRALAIAEDLRRLTRLTERLLHLSRAEAGVALGGEAVDLVPLLRLLTSDLARQGGNAGRFCFDPRALTAFMVRADLDAMGIVLRNLLENALLHGEPGCSIEVRIEADRRISVHNPAPPIPMSEISTLTERFRRLDRAQPGSGLGLTIAETIMRQIGGALVLHSPSRDGRPGFEAVLSFPPFVE